MSRTLIIGDVHGCAEELQEVLRSAQLSAVDKVVFAGDLLDKGPDPIGVVRIARDLADHVKKVVLVEGNHERQHREWRSEMKLGHLKRAAGMTRAEEAYEVVWRLCEADVRFLDSAVLYHQVKSQNVIIVHAGVPPKMKKLPPTSLRTVKQLSPAKRKQALWMEDIRYVTRAGDPVPKGKERKRDVYWAEMYDGRFGVAYFGHQPFRFEERPVSFRHAVALDLGCATGNRLAAALLVPGMFPEYIVAPASYKKNPSEPMVLPDPKDGRLWLGYRQIGDRMVPVAEGRSAGEAYEAAS